MYINFKDYSYINVGYSETSFRDTSDDHHSNIAVQGIVLFKGMSVNLMIGFSTNPDVIINLASGNIRVKMNTTTGAFEFIKVLEKYLRYDEIENPEYFVWWEKKKKLIIIFTERL